jgi:predicted ATPase
MIRRIRVSRYKSFHRAEVELAPFTCIFGPNASGKSNLVDLLSFLSRAVRAESLRDAFRDHRGHALEAFHWPEGFGDEGMSRLQRKKTELSFEVEVVLELPRRDMKRANEELARRERLEGKSSYTRVSERWLRYRLAVGLELPGGEPYVADESLVAIKRNGEPRPRRFPFVARDDERFMLHLEKQNHPRYFPLKRKSTLLSEISDFVNHPHLVAAKNEIASWRTYQVDPTRIRRETGLLGASTPGRRGEDLVPFYYQLKNTDPQTFARIVDALGSIVPSVADLDVREVRPGIIDLYVVEPSGGSFPLRLVSEGTLRLMCVLAVAASPDRPSVVVYEDPERSVHPRKLPDVLSLLRRLSRDGSIQVLVTTHSSDLLDEVSTEDSLVLCSRKPAKGSSLSLFPPGTLLRRPYLEQAMDDAFYRPTEPQVDH